MAALTANRATTKVSDRSIPDQLSLGVAASTKIYQGSLVALNASGYLAPASATTGLIVVGRARQLADNSSGGNAAIVCAVEQGIFKWDNSAGGDACAKTNIGQDCYAVDDHTVALTDGVGARSRAGKIIDIDGTQVLVMTVMMAPDAVPRSSAVGGTIEIPFPAFSAIANGTVVTKLQPGYAGRIKKMSMVVNTAVTTAAKAATLQAQINPAMGAAVSCTGGALALTSANMTPIGAVVDSSAVTAGGTFTAADGISILASAVTAFVEGAGTLLIELG